MPAWLFQTAQVRGRQLAHADIPEINALFARCADYSLLVDGEPPAQGAAEGIFENRPPEVAAKDHFTLGLYTNTDGLIGLLEALRNYPEAGTMYIGLLLLDPDYRGGGVGSTVRSAFAAWAKGQGVGRLKLSVVEENGAALCVWQRLGYRHLRTLPPARFGRKTQARFELALDLANH